MMFSLNLSIATSTAALGLLAAAGGAQSQETIKVGVLVDQTGKTSFYSQPVTEGTLMAVEEVNAAGGVLGRQIELILEDDNGRPDLSATKARKLVDDGVVAIISNSNSGATRQAISVTAESLTPQLASANSAETLTTLDNSCFFQLGPVESLQVKTMLAFTKTKGYGKVALVGDNSGLSTAAVDQFRMGLGEAGVPIVEEQLIPVGSQTAVPQLQKVRAAEPNAIYQVAQIGPQVVQFFQAYQQLGMKQPILGTFNLSSSSYLTTAKGLMDGTVFTDAFDPEKPEAIAFSERFKAKFDKEATSLEAYGHDSVVLIVDAIKRANSTERPAICKAIAETKGLPRVMGAKGTGFDFSRGDRRGFDPEGVVVRAIENNAYTGAVFSGTKN
ncbi:ABC transporter substrate-binding protein [Mesorhizobium sp.]|uniref:ABC transporter substrate-binding protein n=1 Tax=Mesorhizobium sp. TaxID=1871066 RepID=UPI0025BC0549|nr:ABC transporter substrate-binding protein [Mesorhizobium sp.]